MPSVYTFSRTDQEIKKEFRRVFSVGRGSALEQWAMQAELQVEPVGWDALWKLSKAFCKKFEVRFPCIAYIAVNSVDFENLCADVDVLSVQHESVSLPETIDEVPLIELWPTMKQREECINVASTADFIDLLRFYFSEIWMPWDEADDKGLLPNIVQERMQLWLDLQNGTIPKFLGRSITLLRNSAIDTFEKMKELNSTLGEEDDDDVSFPQNYISLSAELNSRLDVLMAKWSLYENEFIRGQCLARELVKWQNIKSRRNVVALWEGGSIFEFGEISKFLASHLTSEYHLSMMTSADEALTLEPEELVVCGLSHQMPEVALSNINITSLNDTSLVATDMRSYLLMLSEDCQLRKLRLLCTLVNTVIVMKSGKLHVTSCVIQDQSPSAQSDFAQGIVAMEGAKVLIEDCTIDNFYSGIVVHKGAQLELRNCIIKNCGVGIQMYSGSKVELNETIIEPCSEQCIRCEFELPSEGSAETQTTGVNGVQGLLVNNNCKIGTGNLQKEVLMVQQDFGF